LAQRFSFRPLIAALSPSAQRSFDFKLIFSRFAAEQQLSALVADRLCSRADAVVRNFGEHCHQSGNALSPVFPDAA
jgi:hypothetical protein